MDLLFIHCIYKSLYLLILNFQSFLPPSTFPLKTTNPFPVPVSLKHIEFKLS